MFALLPPQDVGDARAFLTASIALFAEYAPDTMEHACFEIVRRSDRPTLRLMAEILGNIEAKTREHEERAARRRRLPEPNTPRTPEQQARVDAQVAEARKALGIPVVGLAKFASCGKYGETNSRNTDDAGLGGY